MARERGKRPGKYRAITFALWFGLETLGTVLGFTLGAFLFGAENAAMIFAYMLGIGGAAAGALIAWQIVKNPVRPGRTARDTTREIWTRTMECRATARSR